MRSPQVTCNLLSPHLPTHQHNGIRASTDSQRWSKYYLTNSNHYSKHKYYLQIVFHIESKSASFMEISPIYNWDFEMKIVNSCIWIWVSFSIIQGKRLESESEDWAEAEAGLRPGGASFIPLNMFDVLYQFSGSQFFWEAVTFQPIPSSSSPRCSSNFTPK